MKTRDYEWLDKSLAADWRYLQPETDCKFRGSILDNVAGQVREHRESNGLPEGRPRQDVINFTCAATNPGLCAPIMTDAEVLEAAEIQNSDTGLKKDFNFGDVMRFLQATASALGGKGLVDQETADRRSATCAACPLNMGMAGCYSCSNLASVVYSIIGARETVRNASLMNCGVCGCNLRAKVWLPQDVAEKASEGYRFPSWCWLNTSGSSEQQPETPASQEG